MKGQQKIHDVAPGLRIQVPGWFVGKKDRRAAGKRSGDGNPLLFAPGKLHGVMMHSVLQADGM
jgi:hypothetical protein